MAKDRKKKAPKAVPKQRATVPEVAALDAKHPFSTRSGKDWLHVGMVVALALGLRVVFFYLNQKNNPLFNWPIMDSLYHHDWANQILEEGFWGDEVFFRAPLYPYMLAFFYKISNGSIAFVTFVQHIFGAATSALVYVLAREFFVRKVALLAGILAALYWTFIYFEGELLIVTAILLLNMLFLIFFTKAASRDGAGYLIAAGLTLGLSAIARPSILIVVPAIPVTLYLLRNTTARPMRASDWKFRSGLIVAAALLVILPVIVRNYVVGKDLVPIASQGGVNFYIGNNPSSDGRTAWVPGTRRDWWGGYEDAIAGAEYNEGRKLKQSEVSRYYYNLAFDFMSKRSGEAFRLTLSKVRMFWAGGERSNNKFIYFFWEQAGIGKVPLPGFWLVGPLALLGGVVLWRRRKDLSMMYLFVLLYSVGVIAFFVNARFRLPVVPVLIIFAAYAVFYVSIIYKQRSFELLRAIFVLALAIGVVNHDFLNFNENKTHADAISHYTLGNAYIKMDRKDLAVDEYRRAKETYTAYPTSAYEFIARNVDYNLGTLYWEQGLCSRAIPILQTITGNDEYGVAAQSRLADCLKKQSREAEATEIYEEILRLRPNEPTAMVGVASGYRINERYDEAEALIRKVFEETGPNYVPALIELSAIYQSSERYQEAIGVMRNLQLIPGYEKSTCMALADLYQQLGDRAGAMQVLIDARRFFPPNDQTLETRINQLRAQQ